MACIAMFLIGAPLGAIIKKGGLGMPFLVSILFFIVYYVLTMQGEKLAKTNTISVAVGVWMADAVLLQWDYFSFGKPGRMPGCLRLTSIALCLIK